MNVLCLLLLGACRKYDAYIYIYILLYLNLYCSSELHAAVFYKYGSRVFSVG